ncbi:YccS family putative transporter [Enterobacteriaceae bacterium LUAb1]
MTRFPWQLYHYTFNSRVLYHLRIFFALFGSVAIAWLSGQIIWTIPLILGVVAAALADLDDHLTGRLCNLIITLLCFCIASVSVEWLFPYPWWFIIGLAFSSWGFILLGALGQRYATVAFGALLIAVYTMLGINLFSEWYQQPLLLLAGTLWYNLLTLCGHLLFPVRPLQENLSHSLKKMAHYLDTKATLFDPDADDNDDSALIEVAMANSQLAHALNQTKISIQSRLYGRTGLQETHRTLHYYLAVRDIHERASSSHVRYQQLRSDSRYTDILFRFQRILSMQATACRQWAKNLLMREYYQHNPRFERTFAHLQDALTRLTISSEKCNEIKALEYLFNNLKAIDVQLATLASQQGVEQTLTEESILSSDDQLTGWQDIRLRISRHLSPQSALFRHAVRMSLVLCLGYAFIQITGLRHGYWILLTSLFVCQPNYNATRHRLALRIFGTLAGIAIGLPLLWLIPSIEGQLLLIVISGVLFFAFRTVQYAHATLFITLLVLFCFNILGEGFDVALPRVIDTLLGCLIAWAAVSWIWPDWKFCHLPSVLNNTLNVNYRYLCAIQTQYHEGRDTHLDYRIARRDAHNGNGDLASITADMAADKHVSPEQRDTAFSLLVLNHSFLSYISTLGAHREKSTCSEVLLVLDDTVCYVKNLLLQDANTEDMASLSEGIRARITATSPECHGKEPLILQQLELLVALVPKITAFRQRLHEQ